jgi:hypothetical protein
MKKLCGGTDGATKIRELASFPLIKQLRSTLTHLNTNATEKKYR